jgi:hypothetical protein
MSGLDAEPGVRHRALRDPLLWVLLLIAAVEAAMFVAAAGRGLDLTDEGFYLLTYRHWTEWPSVSLFGAYFSIPFALFGHDVWAMRVLGFALLFGAGIWFGHETGRAFDALANRRSRDGLLATSIACGAAVWSYYGAFLVPYTPSYNLLTLLCALLAFALALRLGRTLLLDEQRGRSGNAFALGLVGSVGIASKFSAGVLVLMLAMLIVCTLGWRRGSAAAWTRMVLALAAGLVLNLALLWLADPGLPARFERGIAVTLAMIPRNPSAELLTLATVELPKELIVSLRILLWPLVFAVLAFVGGALLRRRSLADGLAVALLVVGALLVTFAKDNRVHRIVLTTLIAILVASAAVWVVRKPIGRPARWQALLLAAAILASPFAYSFGTSNPLLRHMGMAAIFPSVLAIAQIRALRLESAIPAWVFAVSLVLATALPAEIAVRQWRDGDYTYRLGAALAEQTALLPRNAGEIELRVAPSLARSLDDYLRLVQGSGFVAGQPMIDFTGQAPGLVAVAGGVPLGAIWFVGGPMFDGDQMARLSLASVDRGARRSAWLLTSDDSFAGIRSWPALLRELGAFAHEEAGRVTVADPTSDDKSKTMEVTLWRPKR